jgi:hypothetical protein
MKNLRPLRPRDSWGSGTYKKALSNVKTAILKKSSQRMNKTSSLKHWEGCFVGILKENYHI